MVFDDALKGDLLDVPKSELDGRLTRFICSRTRPIENVSKYIAELRRIAKEPQKDEKMRMQSKIFKALANNTRLKIINLLMFHEMCVCEVMYALDLTQPTASHHLGILESAGLVRHRKEGKWAFYSLVNPQLVRNLQRLL